MKNIVIILFLLSSLHCIAQETMNVMFYNVENLFDTSDDPETEDDEYTPDGARHWSFSRYMEKIRNLCRVIAVADAEDSPELVGLCEVENDSVMVFLTQRSPLRNIGYDYVMTHSPDERGIDVALLYKKSWFRLLGVESLGVDLTPKGGSATRDVLHVTGCVATGDTVDVYVCHWPSRIGGTGLTEPFRSIEARVIRKSVDGIYSLRLNPYILIMGDMNEDPEGEAIRDGLGAKPFLKASSSDTVLVTLMDTLSRGSYRYEGKWQQYDQFIVSAGFVNGKGKMNVTGLKVLDFEFLLEEDKVYGGQKPNRTYNGYRYIKGGYSDHLPILLDISY